MMVGDVSSLPNPAPADAQCDACPADCLEACFNDAIVAVGGGVRIEAENCAGCGACIPACGFGFIRLQGGVARIVSAKTKPVYAPAGSSPVGNPIVE